jgi:putative Mg2+ transporter-C (MgtC) family protein
MSVIADGRHERGIMHLSDFFRVEHGGQSLLQLGELSLALVLSSLVVLVSKYSDVLTTNVVMDPSRVAAQIVSGIGFIGGGLIFVQRDVVRGLTTAAIIWLAAAVGMACGAGLPLLALFVTGVHFVVIYLFAPLAQRVLSERAELDVKYLPGRGAVDLILQMCAGREFSIQDLDMRPGDAGPNSDMRGMHLHLKGRRGIELLAVSIGA